MQELQWNMLEFIDELEWNLIEELEYNRMYICLLLREYCNVSTLCMMITAGCG
jgi:hypothetical protein